MKTSNIEYFYANFIADRTVNTAPFLFYEDIFFSKGSPKKYDDALFFFLPFLLPFLLH